MRRRTFSVVGQLTLWAAVAGSGGAAPSAVDRWIGQLDAADPVVRHVATEGLCEFGGTAARPAVVRALATASPEAADRLLAVLLRTGPWDVHVNDDPLLKVTFTGYAALSPDDRCGKVEALQGGEGMLPGSSDVLLRVLTADPTAAVRWSAANGLRLRFEDPTRPGIGPAADDGVTVGQLLGRRVVRLLDAPADAAAYPRPADNAPLLAAAAWALRGTDPKRADDLMGRALWLEGEHPSSFRGQADFAYLWAADRAVTRDDVPAAAELFRQLAARSLYAAGEVPEGVADLFALHADHGPTAGFADDLRVYRAYLSRPELMYCLGRVAARVGGPMSGPMMEAAADAAALVAGGPTADAHCGVGRFLFRHGWPELAERELRSCLWLAGGQTADVYFALHDVANDCDDDAAAGRYLEGALRRTRGGLVRTTRYGQMTPWTESDAWAEVHWHYLRAAVTAGDHAAALAEANQLLALDADGHVLTDDPGMAADVVPVLAEAGFAHRADACFAAAYDLLKAQVSAGPAEPMPKNNLAWLCARSGRHLDEADALSAKAVELEPTDAACLDTRAEVLSQLGRAAEAAALEERALSLKPHDLYMQRQLVKFRAAAKAK